MLLAAFPTWSPGAATWGRSPARRRTCGRRAGLPLPSALPGRDGRLPDRGSAGGDLRRPGPRRLPPVPARQRRDAPPVAGSRGGDLVSGRDGAGPDLVRLEGLEVHFPIRGGPWTWSGARPVGYVRAVDGIDLAIRKGEVLASSANTGAERRPPAGSRQADPADGGPPPPRRRRRHRRLGRGPAAGLPSPGPGHLPGPLRDAQPEADDPRLRGRAARGPGPGRRRRRPRAAGPGGPPRGRLRPAADFAFRYRTSSRAASASGS